MKYLIDTNVLSEAVKTAPDKSVMNSEKHNSRILHPASYVERQVKPAIKSNNMAAEVVWTYLVVRAYQSDQQG